ncbi:hypothetical protein C8R46DRAFT_445684 [Mycena filopes]|nr:hypothetical protein C8R46DRAFT_445684 [Mycena filopes]
MTRFQNHETRTLLGYWPRRFFGACAACAAARQARLWIPSLVTIYSRPGDIVGLQVLDCDRGLLIAVVDRPPTKLDYHVGCLALRNRQRPFTDDHYGARVANVSIYPRDSGSFVEDLCIVAGCATMVAPHVLPSYDRRSVYIAAAYRPSWRCATNRRRGTTPIVAAARLALQATYDCRRRYSPTGRRGGCVCYRCEDFGYC